jgi:hypothetical protein
MSKRYRPWKIDEPMLLPTTVQEFVDKDHLARFVLNLVVEEIDLKEIERVYRVARGQPPFDPAAMPQPGPVPRRARAGARCYARRRRRS